MSLVPQKAPEPCPWRASPEPAEGPVLIWSKGPVPKLAVGEHPFVVSRAEVFRRTVSNHTRRQPCPSRRPNPSGVGAGPRPARLPRNLHRQPTPVRGGPGRCTRRTESNHPPDEATTPNPPSSPPMQRRRPRPARLPVVTPLPQIETSRSSPGPIWSSAERMSSTRSSTLGHAVESRTTTASLPPARFC